MIFKTDKKTLSFCAAVSSRRFGSNGGFFEASWCRAKVFAWCQDIAQFYWVGREAGSSSSKNAGQGLQCYNGTGCGCFGSFERVLMVGRCGRQTEDNGGRDDRWGGSRSGKAGHARLPHAASLHDCRLVRAVESKAGKRERGSAEIVQACLASWTAVSFGADTCHLVVHGILQHREPYVWQRQI